jgi:hypothetical protein
MEFGVAWDRKDPAKIGVPYTPKFRISEEIYTLLYGFIDVQSAPR